MRTFDRDDVEALRDDLDTKITKGVLAWKTVASVWTLVTSMCSDMVSAKKREFRTRKDNPCADVKPPERGDKKAKQYLYPSEFLTFVSCEAVPLRLRRGVAIAVYTFVRDGELRELRWDGGDLDLAHGTLSVTRSVTRTGAVKSTKSGETRRFAVEPNILPLLRALHTEAEGKGHVVRFRDRHMARDLRLWLTRAGVNRPELHKGDAHRKPITWHDLRATGITWMAVRGDDPLKIKQRAGHSTFSTTEGYIREAEALRDGFGDVFPPLPDALFPIAPNRPGTIESGGSSQKQAKMGGDAGNRTLASGILKSRRCRSSFVARVRESHRFRPNEQSSGIHWSPPGSPRFLETLLETAKMPAGAVRGALTRVDSAPSEAASSVPGRPNLPQSSM